MPCLFYSVHVKQCQYDAEADGERATDNEVADINDNVHDDSEADDDSDTDDSINHRG